MSESESPLSPTPPESGVHDLFIGPNGLRAGWRLLVFLAIVAILGFLAYVLAAFLFPKLQLRFSAPGVIVQEVVWFGIVALATAIMGRIEHRSFADYGLPARGFLGRKFWIGTLWGFAMLSLLVGLMAISHAYTEAGLALPPARLLKYGLLWAIAFLLVGVFEEFAFRGYMLYTLTTGIGFWPAAVITCAVFAGAHLGNPGENWVGVLEIVLIAIYLCLALRRTGNLWFAIGWHMAFDWGETFFYSTPNSGMQGAGHMLKASLLGSKWLSGGSVGPEASVFDVIVTVAGILLLLILYPEAKYPAAPTLAIHPATESQILQPPAPA